MCQIRGGWPSRTNIPGCSSALLFVMGPFPCFLLLGRNFIKEWNPSPTQRLKFWPPHFVLLIFLISFMYSLRFSRKKKFNFVFKIIYLSTQFSYVWLGVRLDYDSINTIPLIFIINKKKKTLNFPFVLLVTIIIYKVITNTFFVWK